MNAFNCNNGQWNAWVAKFNMNNSGASSLLYSNLFGGSTNDYGSSVAADSQQNVYVAGSTQSTDFPTTVGALQTTNDDTYFGDGFVTKINPQGNGFVYSTLLGPRAGDYGGNYAAVAVEPDQTAVVVGGGHVTTNNNSTCCAYLTHLSADGTQALYSYLWGGWSTNANNVTLDSSGNAYVVGTSQGGVPTTAGAYAACPNLNNCSTNGSYNDAFVMKFSGFGASCMATSGSI